MDQNQTSGRVIVPGPMKIDDARRRQMIADVQKFFRTEFEEELSAFRAERLLELFLRTLGPHAYNEGVRDAHTYMQRKLDDLDGEVFPRYAD